MLIMKFGGTSVRDADCIKAVCEIVQSQNCEVVVVCSALCGVTDRLIEIAGIASHGRDSYRQRFEELCVLHFACVDALFVGERHQAVSACLKEMFAQLDEVLRGVFLIRECTPRTMDLVMSFGERLSNVIVCEALLGQGVSAVYLDARYVVKTDNEFGNARVLKDETYRNIVNHSNGDFRVRVVTGFIASTKDGETTTLGRGGSDYTASLFGSALNAAEIQIWTDVDGVLSADPRAVKHARCIENMTYEEAMEMSHFGAKVIYPPTMQPALDARIPIRIKNTFNPNHTGTLISNQSVAPTVNQVATSKSGNAVARPVTGISSICDIAMIRVHGSGMIGVTGTAGRLFSALAREHINIILITQASSEHSICFAINPKDARRAVEVINEEFEMQIFNRQIEGIHVENDLSVIAVIGERMRQTPGISGRVFGSLGERGVNVVAVAQGSSERNISIVVSRSQVNQAVQAIHDEFFWKDDNLHLFVVGTGLIGSMFLKQVKNLQTYEPNRIHVHAIANSRQMLLFSENINEPLAFQNNDANQEKVVPANLSQLVSFAIDLPFKRKVFVDCTASDEPVGYYELLLSAGISIVTPNKKAASSNIELYKRIQRAKNAHALFGYETNVGAGLPVIGTIRALRETGDKILEIQGVFSGTLSYLFNTYDGTQSFSKLVAMAKAKGFTEPDPRDDLSGLDVARKLLILAREIGLDLNLEDVEVENLTPEQYRKIESVDEFLASLSNADEWFASRFKQASAEGKLLRYIGRIKDGRVTVQLEAVGSHEPCYGLSGSDNLIAITSEYYKERPLVISGPGAGAEVTAAGVLNDVLKCG